MLPERGQAAVDDVRTTWEQFVQPSWHFVKGVLQVFCPSRLSMYVVPAVFLLLELSVVMFVVWVRRGWTLYDGDPSTMAASDREAISIMDTNSQVVFRTEHGLRFQALSQSAIVYGHRRAPDADDDGDDNPEDPVVYESVERINEEQRKIKRILFWVPFWDHDDFYFGYGREPFFRHQCKTNECETTADRNHYNSSDAVLVHINNVQFPSDLPQFRHPRHKWIYFNMEPPHQTRPNLHPFNWYFNATVSYRLDSDIPNPYGAILPLTPGERLAQSVKPLKNFAEKRTKLIAWFVSNCGAPSKRDWYAHQLQRFVPVDVYGKCGPFQCPKGKDPNRCYKMLQRNYKFYLAFENNICKDYITEKLWNILKMEVVPIVLGGGDYASLLPSKSYIDVRDFDSPKALATHILKLHENDDLYNEYFAWKNRYKVIFPYTRFFCDLCAYLHKTEGRRKIHRNLAQWHSESNSCLPAQNYFKNIRGLLL